MADKKESLFENTAIRYDTPMNYKTIAELKGAGLLNDGDRIVFDDIARIMRNLKNACISQRAKEIISETAKKEYEVKTSALRYMKTAEKNDIKVITSEDKDYPFPWTVLSGMPEIVFIRGDASILSHITSCGSCAMVGSREPGRYSLYATGEFSEQLSRKGVIIVSGLALGIDRKAHETCLDAGGKTIAVVAGGTDVIYPYQNRDIYDRLCSDGLILSELPPGKEVKRQYFPSRNRLISALGDVCLIMEAGMYSGTLHTASFAASQGKDVFVLPNSIYSGGSMGGLLLLRDGAEVLIDSDTVYDRISGEVDNRKIILGEKFIPEGCVSEGNRLKTLRNTAKTKPGNLTEEDWKDLICDELSERPRNIDDLFVSLGIPFSFLSAIVTGLESEGRISNERGKYVLTIHGR